MSVKIVPRHKQAIGEFNGGAIVENKPIGFPQDGGELKPYSNLFYWAYAWTENGSTIREHSHKGFEIMSFVLKGEIEHYDSKLKSWKKLHEGDAQIIRSGSGISHAEKLFANSAIFQIWFDPDLKKTLGKPATYTDYSDEMFPIINQDTMSTKVYKGENAPIEMDAEGIVIKELSLKTGIHRFELNSNDVYSAYLITGTLDIEGKEMKESDFLIVKGQDNLEIIASAESRLFVIQSPLVPAYRKLKQLLSQFNN